MSGGTEENHESSQSVADAPAKNGTENLPIKSLER
jgi:hypothetical protein